MTIVVGHADLLRNNPSNASAIDAIQHAAARATDLLRSLNGTSASPETRIDTHTELAALLISITPQLAHTTATSVSLNARHCDIPGITGLFSRAMENALRNAVEAMPDGGQLDVSTRNAYPGEYTSVTIGNNDATRERCIISISNSGTGLPATDLIRVYQNPGFSSKTGGYGYGIHSILAAVNHLNGGILISARADGGIRIEFIFPVAASQPLAGRPGIATGFGTHAGPPESLPGRIAPPNT